MEHNTSSNLLRVSGTKAWGIDVVRVQLPGSHPTEFQWQFEVNRDQPVWTDYEMAPIEEVLIEYMSPEANATWKFHKSEQEITITRPNWIGSVSRKTPKETALFLRHWYDTLQGKTAREF